MKKERLDSDLKDWSSRPAYKSLSRKADLDQAQDLGFSNPRRSRLSAELHKGPIVEDMINTELQGTVGAGADLLINQPWNSTREIAKGLWKTSGKTLSDFSNNNSDPTVVRLKKYGMIGAAGLFAMYALQSSMQLVKSLWTGDQSNKGIQLIDAFMKWVMGAGFWCTALGKAGRFQGLAPLLGGTGLTILLSQLKGIGIGQSNLLSKASRTVGVQDVVKNGLDVLSMAPKFVDR